MTPKQVVPLAIVLTVGYSLPANTESTGREKRGYVTFQCPKEVKLPLLKQGQLNNPDTASYSSLYWKHRHQYLEVFINLQAKTTISAGETVEFFANEHFPVYKLPLHFSSMVAVLKSSSASNNEARCNYNVYFVIPNKNKSGTIRQYFRNVTVSHFIHGGDPFHPDPTAEVISCTHVHRRVGDSMRCIYTLPIDK